MGILKCLCNIDSVFRVTKFDVFTTVRTHIIVFYVVTPCDLVGGYKLFGKIYCLYFQMRNFTRYTCSMFILHFITFCRTAKIWDVTSSNLGWNIEYPVRFCHDFSMLLQNKFLILFDSLSLLFSLLSISHYDDVSMVALHTWVQWTELLKYIT
jgi:hypothetical protein